MTALKKKIFSNKQYQFGYNDAMDVAFNNERKLKAKVEELRECVNIAQDYVDSEHLIAKFAAALQEGEGE